MQERAAVNLHNGVFVAVKSSPSWRMRAIRGTRTVQQRAAMPATTAPVNPAEKRGWSFRLPRRASDANVATILQQYEYASMSPVRRFAAATWRVGKRPLRIAFLVAAAFLCGFKIASGPDLVLSTIQLRDELSRNQLNLRAREGELELVRLEMLRLNSVMENSRKYGISADKAADIYDVALAEGIDTKIAFELVNTESEFNHRAISPKGAVGLAQVMPSTAFELDPRLRYDDLFDRRTNLRIGFRYLKDLLRQYHGNLRYALLAYNRGPATVDQIRRAGGDPENGYARTIMGDR